MVGRKMRKSVLKSADAVSVAKVPFWGWGAAHAASRLAGFTHWPEGEMGGAKGKSGCSLQERLQTRQFGK